MPSFSPGEHLEVDAADDLARAPAAAEPDAHAAQRQQGPLPSCWHCAWPDDSVAWPDDSVSPSRRLECEASAERMTSRVGAPWPGAPGLAGGRGPGVIEPSTEGRRAPVHEGTWPGGREG